MSPPLPPSHPGATSPARRSLTNLATCELLSIFFPVSLAPRNPPLPNRIQCVRVPRLQRPHRRMQELRGYATTTAQLLAMAAWLRHWHVQRVVM
jgi:hypothetical protein